MTDIVENRKRITIGRKVKLLQLALKENGFTWCFFFGLYYLGSTSANAAFRQMEALRRKHNLPGLNSASINREIWESWDWGAGGEEWTISDEWKDSLVKCVMLKHIKSGTDLLEIGPGGGRWTEHLQKLAGSLVGVDISEKCVEVCREKFKDCDNVRFFANKGNDLSGIEDRSLDAIWSFDVFVHINKKEVGQYVGEFFRVLRPGGIGVIHHGTNAGMEGGWRSNLTCTDFDGVLGDAGLRVVSRFENWLDDGRQYEVGRYGDVITVFEK